MRLRCFLGDCLSVLESLMQVNHRLQRSGPVGRSFAVVGSRAAVLQSPSLAVSQLPGSELRFLPAPFCLWRRARADGAPVGWVSHVGWNDSARLVTVRRRGERFPALLCLLRRARRLGCVRRTWRTWRARSPRWRTWGSARCRRPRRGSLEGLPALRAFLGAHVIAHIVALHANPRAHRR